jgi:hypothetical protein
MRLRGNKMTHVETHNFEPIQETYQYMAGQTFANTKRYKGHSVEFNGMAVLERSVEIISEAVENSLPGDQALLNDPRFALGVVQGVYTWAKGASDFQKRAGTVDRTQVLAHQLVVRADELLGNAPATTEGDTV